MLHIPWEVVDLTTSADLAEARGSSAEHRAANWAYAVRSQHVTDTLLKHLVEVVPGGTGVRGSYAEAIATIQAARTGEFRSVTSRFALPEVLLAYLAVGAIDGWVYAEMLGHTQPVLIDDVGLSGNGVHLMLWGYSAFSKGYTNAIFDFHCSVRGPQSPWTLSRSFRAEAADSGSPGAWLHRLGLRKETYGLQSQYLKHLDKLHEITAAGPGMRCTVSGTVYHPEHKVWEIRDREIITDTITVPDRLAEDDPRSKSLPLVPGDRNLSRTPTDLVLEVFDPVANNPRVAHIADLTPHVYNDAIGDLLVLPAAHQRLLDMLTSDTTSYIADIVDDRTAGNTVLCSGPPGTGKTLTAQVYAERLHKAIYSVDSGVLLSKSIHGVRAVLDEVLERCTRWDAILLLDEADVIVSQRGSDFDRNTLTAAFLRVMETFDRLCFMTTNRLEDIDDAIAARCAALLVYAVPNGQDAVRAWRVLAGTHKIDLSDELVDQLTTTLPRISPRDMRQILRLAVQFCAQEGRALDIDAFCQVAPYRGITPKPPWHRPEEPRHPGTFPELPENSNS